MTEARFDAPPGAWSTLVRVLDELARSFAAARGLECQVSREDQPRWHLWRDDEWQGFTRSRMVEVSLSSYLSGPPIVTVAPDARLLNSTKGVARDLAQLLEADRIPVEPNERGGALRDRIWPRIDAAWQALVGLGDSHYAAEKPLSSSGSPA